MDKERKQELDAAMITIEAIYVKSDHSPIARNKPYSRSYAELTDMLHDVLERRLVGEPPDDVRQLPFTKLFSMAEMVLYSIRKTPDMLLEVARPSYNGDPLVCHSLNTAFLSCAVGCQIDLSVKEITELGVAALLHDIGMTKIDPAYYAHGRSLSKAEQKKVEMHPMAGYTFFENLRSDFPWLLSVILEEHKRENDQGYGETLGGELHTFSRIVGICDSFEALTHQRPFRKPFHPSDAMKAIIADKEVLYSKPILRAFIEALGIYPVGSMVKLNNNMTGRVLRTIPGAPLRPVVSTIEENEPDIEPLVIDLSKDTNIYIVSIVYADEYARPEGKDVHGER
ncbi:MAG: HD domain-containing protein [Chitinispirillaceae bacterium]|nr:HD domain-containing protein [Chitinispirillaceae bacterium]